MKNFPTFKKFKAEILKLVKRSPDNVYDSGEGHGACYYHKGKCTDGSRGCIMGQALKACGVSDYALKGLGVETINVVCTTEEVGYSEREVDWLSCLQGAQDTYKTWGSALAQANEYYPLA